MGRASRAKGKRGQRELAALLRDCGWVDAHTEAGAQSDGARVPDVDAPGLPIWIECKVGKRLDLLAAYRQAVGDAPGDRQPCVIARLVAGEGKRDDPCRQWMALVDAEWLLLILSLGGLR